MPRIKLTSRVLETLSGRANDATVVGLFAEKSKTDDRVVIFRVRAQLREGVRTGAARTAENLKATLGRWPDMTLEAARAEARRWLAEVKAGRDPREQPKVPAGTWTVGRARDEYVADLRLREKADGTIANLETSFSKHLTDWLGLPLTGVTREMARERHAKVAASTGPVAANHALKALRTVYNFAKRVHDTPLGENPVDAVTFARERSANRSIAPVDLAGWHAKLQTLSSPARRVMHELGLFTGLRPGNLVALERGWIDFDHHAIILPATVMKGRQEFHLPISTHIEGLLRQAVDLARGQAPHEPWLFPTRDKFGSKWIATQVWKEKKLPSETGHMLRHTYSNAAHNADVDDVDRELLLAHQIPGVKGTYLHAPALMARLLEQQAKVSAYLLSHIAPRA